MSWATDLKIIAWPWKHGYQRYSDNYRMKVAISKFGLLMLMLKHTCFCKLWGIYKIISSYRSQ